MRQATHLTLIVKANRPSLQYPTSVGVTVAPRTSQPPRHIISCLRTSWSRHLVQVFAHLPPSCENLLFLATFFVPVDVRGILIDMGNQGSHLADQAAQLDGEYALILDSQKNIHQFPGPEGVANESANNWLELQILQWREDIPTLVLKMAPASSGPEFQQQLDQSTDAVKFIFQLPAEYPGGRVGLLRNIQDLVVGVNPYGIVETVVGRRATSRYLTRKISSRQHRKELFWTNGPKAFNCKVGWTQFSSQYFFKFRVTTGEMALLVVNRHDDEYKSAVGQRQKPQQQLYFMQLMALPVRIWISVQNHLRPSARDGSEEREPHVEKPAAKTIHGASPLDTEEGSSTGILGEFKKLVGDLAQQAARSAADVVDDDESVTGHPSLDSQGPENSVVLPSEGKPAEEEGISNTPQAQSQSAACDDLTMEKTGLTKTQKKNKRKKKQKKNKKAYHKGLKEAHADAQPQQDPSNDEQSASAVCGASGQDLVAGVEGTLRSPTSGSASFLSARSACSPSPSRISTDSRNFQTPPLVPFTGESDEEGVPEHQTSRDEPDSEATSLSGDSRERSEDTSQEEVIILETMAGAQRESHVQRSLTPANPTTHPPGISPRSDCESPTSTAKVEPVPGATSPLLAVGDKHQKRDSKAPKGHQDATKPGDQLDDTCAATAHVEARPQEVSPEDVFGITDQPLQPRAEPSSGLATRHRSPKKAQGQQRAGDITTLAKTPLSLDSIQASTASAVDQSSVSGPVTPRPTSYPSLVTSPKSADIRPLSTAAVSASHPQRDEPSSASTPTRTPGLSPTPAVSVGHHPTQRGAPVKRAPPVQTPSLRQKAAVPAGRAPQGSAQTYANPAKTPAFRAEVPAGNHQVGGFVSGVKTARTPGPMTAVVSAGPHGGFAPSPTVVPGYGAYQQSPSQGHQASTSAVMSWESNPSASPLQPLGASCEAYGGGAYPTPPTRTAPDPSDVPGKHVEYKQWQPDRGKFFWDLTYHSFLCAKEGCEERCNLWDCQSVVCPFCGPFSHVMYCGKEHMREDVGTHWVHCGGAPMEHPCVDSSIPPDVRVGPPAIPCKHEWDTPERHRQAVWFTTARQEGDYFIFVDWADPHASLGTWEGRCSSDVGLIVRFDDPVEKDRFRRILAVCLLESVEVQPLVAYMFRLLRDTLRAKNQWSDKVDYKIRCQIFWELGVSLDIELLGKRHACETEWNGKPPRHCRDPTCVAERRNLLGVIGWDQCFERLVSNEECSRWLLRAHRTTHPTVRSVYDRTRGEGFDDVVDEEKRLFQRGEAWDGPGTGPMEMEGREVC